MFALTFLVVWLDGMICKGQRVTIKSPYYQYLPDCPDNLHTELIKKTKLTAILCPMIKDEEGFLSEWTAYYEMHGFNHIVFYDHNSSQSFRELQPWIDFGFVSIRRNWNDSLDYHTIRHSDELHVKDTDVLNSLAQIDCKKTALTLGFDLYLPLDIDEYLIPRFPNQTIIDDLSDWMITMKKNMIPLPKWNFSPVPHFHEPIHLLTIEAYLSRHPLLRRLNYYIGTQNKVMLRLQSPDYPSSYQETIRKLLIYCCNIHGCSFGTNVIVIDNFQCNQSIHHELYSRYIWPKDLTVRKLRKKWIEPPKINHYARSLEKFELKQKNWDNLAKGNDSLGNSQGSNVVNFLHRAFGTYYDDSALAWSCRLRAHLRNRTGERDYLRPGDFWIRNPEFGRKVSDGRKRGRKGMPLGRKIRPIEMNPYPVGVTYQRVHDIY